MEARPDRDCHSCSSTFLRPGTARKVSSRPPSSCIPQPSHPLPVLPSCSHQKSRSHLQFLSPFQMPCGPAGQARAAHSTPGWLQDLTPHFPPALPRPPYTGPHPHTFQSILLPRLASFQGILAPSAPALPPGLALQAAASSTPPPANICDVPMDRPSGDSWVGNGMLVTIMRTLGRESGDCSRTCWVSVEVTGVYF